MKSIQDITISKLKRQPKHGTGLEDLLNKFKEMNSSGVISKVTDDIDAFKETFISLPKVLEASATAITTTITDLDKLSAGYGRINALQSQYQTAVLTQIKNTTALEEANAELNKTLKMSSARAFDFSKMLRGQAESLKIGDATLFKYAKTLDGVTGGLSSFANKMKGDVAKELLQTQTYLQENLQVTDEQAAAFELYAAGMKMTGGQALLELNKVSEQVAKALGDGTDKAQIQSQIVADIAEAGEVIQLQYSRMPGNLEIATLKARALGTTLKQLHSTGEAMLNIESSIGQELEYQALTGRRLVDDQGKSLTNEYRMATIRGDQTRQAELMSQFIEKEGDNLKNNLFARKKAAELMGTDEASLARMIQKRELLQDLGAQEIMNLNADDARTAIEKMRKDAESEGDADRIKKIDSLLEATDTRTTAERSEQHLLAIRSALTGEQIQAGQTGKDFIGGLRTGDSKAAFDYATTMIKGITSTDTVKAFGALSVTADRLSTAATPLKQIEKLLPGVIGKFVTAATDGMNKLNEILPKSQIIPEGNNTGKNAKGGPVAAGDISLVGEQGPELVQFARNAYVTPTNQTKAALGGPGIDYARLGAAVAMAMQSANITATVRTDNLYGTSRMNPMPKNLG